MKHCRNCFSLHKAEACAECTRSCFSLHRAKLDPYPIFKVMFGKKFNEELVVELVTSSVPLALTPEDDPRREELKKLQERKEEIDRQAHKQNAGFSAAADATRVSILLGVFKLITTGAAVLIVDKLGRRPLLLGGVSGMVISLMLLGAYYTFLGDAPAVAVIGLLLYVGCYQVMLFIFAS